MCPLKNPETSREDVAISMRDQYTWQGRRLRVGSIMATLRKHTFHHRSQRGGDDDEDGSHQCVETFYFGDRIKVKGG